MVSVEGEFERDAALACRTQDGQKFACGLIDYLTGEACGIARKAVGQVEVLLGYLDEPELTTRRTWRCAGEPNRKTIPAGNFQWLSGERFISNTADSTIQRRDSVRSQTMLARRMRF